MFVFFLSIHIKRIFSFTDLLFTRREVRLGDLDRPVNLLFFRWFARKTPDRGPFVKY